MNDQGTPLWQASRNGHLVVVQHLLASGREIDTRKRSTFNNNTAAQQGRQQPSVPKSANETEDDFQRRKTCGPLCADLIDAYEKDPAKVRSQLRKQLGLPGNPPPRITPTFPSSPLFLTFRSFFPHLCRSCLFSCKDCLIHPTSQYLQVSRPRDGHLILEATCHSPTHPGPCCHPIHAW